MELLTAERQERNARADLQHALDMIARADSERARARHMRRLNVAAERIRAARFSIRALSGEALDALHL
jgi:hypothetical protein